MSGSRSYLCVDGNLIGNACQTATYIALGLACDKWKCPPWFDRKTGHCIESDCACALLEDDDGNQLSYLSPGNILDTDADGNHTYEACWYDPNDPASAEFFGIVICERIVSQRIRRKITSTGCGGSIGPQDRGPVEVTFEAWIVASSEAGSLFGYRYLTDALGLGPFADTGCPSRTVSYLEHCGTDTDNGIRRMIDAAATSEVENITPDGFGLCCGMKVQWTMVSESPWLFGARDYCAEGATFEDCAIAMQCPTDCPDPDTGCGPKCTITVEPAVTVTDRPRRECVLLVYPGGETCPEVAMEDYSECTWLPVATPYPEGTTDSTGDVIINVDATGEEDCVECPVQLVWDGATLTWEPLPGFEAWHTLNEPIDYSACCPKVLLICQPNPAVNPILCAQQNQIPLNADDSIDTSELDAFPAGTRFLVVDSDPAKQAIWDKYKAFMDCIGINVSTVNDLGDFPNDPPEPGDCAAFDVAAIFKDPDTDCWVFGRASGESCIAPGQSVENLIVENPIPGTCGDVLDFEAQLYTAPPSGPVCCNLILNPDRTVLTPGVTDFQAVLDSGQCTFEIVCEEGDDDPTGPANVVCPKVVHVLMNDPANPNSNSMVLTVGGVNEGDTVIIDNNPVDPIPVETSFAVHRLTCDDPCHAGGFIRPQQPARDFANCYCPPPVVSVQCKEIEAESGARAVGWAVRPGSLPLRNTRIRFWPNPKGLDGPDINPELWACVRPCSTVEIGYLKADERLEYDPEEGRLRIICTNGSSRAAGIRATGPMGRRYTPAAIPPGVPMVVCVEVDPSNTAADMNFDMWTQTVSVPVPA